MSVWLTPELKPFYGGTYFPPDDAMWGSPGFIDILREIARVWGAERDKIAAIGGRGDRAAADRRSRSAPPAAIPDAGALARTVTQFRQAFDSRHGGFGDAPKFPRPSELLFLLREYARTGDADARDMVLATLRAMALGGMRDHVGGGFHRYSVDAAWRVPHFEKMLYDQAQLVLAYLEAAQASGDRVLPERRARTRCCYVMREMTDPRRRLLLRRRRRQRPARAGRTARPRTRRKARSTCGRPPSWRRSSAKTPPIVNRGSGSNANGNAPVDPQQEFTGKNLLYGARSIEELAKEFGNPSRTSSTILNRARVEMFEARERASPAASRRQGADGLERSHDRRLSPGWSGSSRARHGPDESAGPYLEAATSCGHLHPRSHVEPGHDRRSPTLPRRRRGDRRVRRRLRLSHLRTARALSGRRRSATGSHWAITLQHRQDELFWDETGRRMVQHQRPRSERAGADERGLRRRRADRKLRLADESARPFAPGREQGLEREDRPNLPPVRRASRADGSCRARWWLRRSRPMSPGRSRSSSSVTGAGDNSALEAAVAARYSPFSVTLSLTSEQQKSLPLRCRSSGPCIQSAARPPRTCARTSPASNQLRQWSNWTGRLPETSEIYNLPLGIRNSRDSHVEPRTRTEH